MKTRAGAKRPKKTHRRKTHCSEGQCKTWGPGSGYHLNNLNRILNEYAVKTMDRTLAEFRSSLLDAVFLGARFHRFLPALRRRGRK